LTGNKGLTKEWICAHIVKSTEVDQVSHLLIESKIKKDENDPAVLYTDACPHNVLFYKKIYGDRLVMRLGLFHLLHIVVDMLDAHSMMYWKVLVKLKACFYTYRETNLSALLWYMMDGTFYRYFRGLRLMLSSTPRNGRADSIASSKKYSSWELGPSINLLLSKRIDECKDLADDTGCQAFTNIMRKAVNNQLKNVEYAKDPNDINMYTQP
jgi:hypothetical protein